jgi:hypothetical protein
MTFFLIPQQTNNVIALTSNLFLTLPMLQIKGHPFASLHLD